MLQKSTKEHRFSIHLTATHDQSKNDCNALFNGCTTQKSMNIRFFTVLANIGYFFPGKLIKTLPLATITVYV